MTLLHVGYGCYVVAENIDAIIPVTSEPVRRYMQALEEGNKLVKASMGRKSRSLIIMKSGNVVVSAVDSITLANRFTKNDNMSK